MAKALIIKSSTTEKNEITGVWHKLEAIKPYIQGIKTSDIVQDKDTIDAEALNTLISGVPTPWARAKLFWFAFEYLTNQDANIETGGLIDFYKILVNEWKGLLALVSLYSDRITFSEPIYLDERGELWDLTSAFGRVLFEDKYLWCNPENLKNPDEKPYIQLIYYGQDKQLIGATSPYSVFLTAIDYTCLTNISDVKWYRFGKFEDPINFLTNDQLQKVYLVLRNLNKNLLNFEESLRNKNNPNFNIKGFRKYLQDWEREIKRKNKNLLDRGPIPKLNLVNPPFKELFLSEQKVYQKADGSLTFTKPEKDFLLEIPDLQMLLKQDNILIGWFELNARNQSLKNSAVHYITVNNIKDKSNPVLYFSVPLSIYGIRLFRNKINSLLNSARGDSLIGRITDEGTLLVELSVIVDGDEIKLNPREYKIQWETNERKIFMWPNFISDNWKNYYYYTEYPLNLPGIKFIPFYKRSSQIIVSKPNKECDSDFIFPTSSKEILVENKVEVNYLVKYPINEVPEENAKYEIILSNTPIAGLEVRIDIQGKNLNAGYLLIKNPDDPSLEKGTLQELTTEPFKDEAIVGVDFGSTNSCVHYALKSNIQSANPIRFTNRRIPLLGIENKAKSLAENNELLFFQNENVINGQIKSWLHEHDERYIKNSRDAEIAGGVPIYENNILVKDMDKFKITTQAGILHYNMKWLSDEPGWRKKTAYLKTSWLQACADLYAQKYKPVELRWSYPGSLSRDDLNQFNIIYSSDLKSLIPIHLDNKPITVNVEDPITESEAVCKYALTKEFALNHDNLFLGIDVGGSTSDILLMGIDGNDENKYRLFKQSSIRVAAGVFFDAIINSEKFRKVIVDFHDSGRTNLWIENIKDVLTKKVTSPFYLNNIFDQLNENELIKFYAFIGKEASFVFTIPAYVTGLLLYYAGKLVAKLIEENKFKYKQVDLLPFGKGGRIFQWMNTFPGKYLCKPYYEECFKLGIGPNNSDIQFIKHDEILVENKSEVSKGLAVTKEIKMDTNIRRTSDIFGERGIKLQGKDGSIFNIDEFTELKSEYFRELNNMRFPTEFCNFQEFINKYLLFIGPETTGIIKDTCKLMNYNQELSSRLKSYLENDPEYNKVKNSNNFDFRYPIFIAEGMCFLEKILIPEVFKN